MNYRTFGQYLGTGVLLGLIPVVGASPAFTANTSTHEQSSQMAERYDGDASEPTLLERYRDAEDIDGDARNEYDGAEMGDREVGENAERPEDTYGWSAWANLMPGPDYDPQLRVKGRVTLPSAGYSARLVETGDRLDPHTLVLKLDIEDPATDRLEDVSSLTTSVSYEEDYNDTYDRIAIRDEGGAILQTIDIQRVY